MAKRLLIVDDDARFRGLLRQLLELAPEFEVVGEAHQGDSALVPGPLDEVVLPSP